MARQEGALIGLVVDTNIVAAAVLRKGTTRNLFFNSGLELYCPERLAEELYRHEKEFVSRSGLDLDSFLKAVRIVLSQLTSVPVADYAGFAKKARLVSPDADDWPFIALALARGCPLWSNDKRLKAQNAVPVLSTKELLELLETQPPSRQE